MTTLTLTPATTLSAASMTLPSATTYPSSTTYPSDQIGLTLTVNVSGTLTLTAA